jgi:hypothetical protein
MIAELLFWWFITGAAFVGLWGFLGAIGDKRRQ